jgi:hypothetical protein
MHIVTVRVPEAAHRVRPPQLSGMANAKQSGGLPLSEHPLIRQNMV